VPSAGPMAVGHHPCLLLQLLLVVACTMRHQVLKAGATLLTAGHTTTRQAGGQKQARNTVDSTTDTILLVVPVHAPHMPLQGNEVLYGCMLEASHLLPQAVEQACRLPWNGREALGSCTAPCSNRELLQLMPY